MAHVDEILVGLLANVSEKRFITQSRDLFLAFKAVYTSESLSEKLLSVIKSTDNEADVVGLLLQLLRMTDRGFKLLRPSLQMLVWVDQHVPKPHSSQMRQHLAGLCAQLTKVLDQNQKI